MPNPLSRNLRYQHLKSVFFILDNRLFLDAYTDSIGYLYREKRFWIYDYKYESDFGTANFIYTYSKVNMNSKSDF